MEKSIINKNIIDFTKHKSVNLDNFLKKIKNKKFVHIIDYIYPLTTLPLKSYLIRDHVNLSGFNPLKGPIFIRLNNVYRFSKNKKSIVIAGLKSGVKPTKKEKFKLLNSGIKAYCYNLVPTVILAASLDLKVVATGIIKEQED